MNLTNICDRETEKFVYKRKKVTLNLKFGGTSYAFYTCKFTTKNAYKAHCAHTHTHEQEKHMPNSH